MSAAIVTVAKCKVASFSAWPRPYGPMLTVKTTLPERIEREI